MMQVKLSLFLQMLVLNAFYFFCVVVSLALFIASMYSPWILVNLSNNKELVPADYQYDISETRDLIDLAKEAKDLPEFQFIQTMLVLASASMGLALLLIVFRLRIMIVIQLLLLVATVSGFVAFARFTKMNPVLWALTDGVNNLKMKFRQQGYVMAAVASFLALLALVISIIITNLSLILVALLIAGATAGGVLISQGKSVDPSTFITKVNEI